MANAYLGLDVGTKRIGVALADAAIGIAIPYDTVEVDGTDVAALTEMITAESVQHVVVGYPRNQAGEPTMQTDLVVAYMEQFRHLDVDIVFQDESLTSVMAEDRLKASGRPYAKGDIDAQAAAIILQDYLEAERG